jgi:hypothetical protein
VWGWPPRHNDLSVDGTMTVTGAVGEFWANWVTHQPVVLTHFRPRFFVGQPYRLITHYSFLGSWVDPLKSAS